MTLLAGMLRYNSDAKVLQRSTDEGSNWAELDLSGTSKIGFNTVGEISVTGNTELTAVSRLSFFRIRATALTTVTSIIGNGNTTPTDGDIVIIYTGRERVDIVNESGSASAAAYRINTGINGSTISLFTGGSITLIYDSQLSRWFVLEFNQSVWITPTFSAGDFTASGSMTWTVGSGDVFTYAYILNGNKLTISFVLATTSVGGTLGPTLQIKIPGGFVATKQMFSTCYIADNGVSSIGRCSVDASGTVIKIQRVDVTNYTAATDATNIFGQITIEV